MPKLVVLVQQEVSGVLALGNLKAALNQLLLVPLEVVGQARRDDEAVVVGGLVSCVRRQRDTFCVLEYKVVEEAADLDQFGGILYVIEVKRTSENLAATLDVAQGPFNSNPQATHLFVELESTLTES